MSEYWPSLSSFGMKVLRSLKRENQNPNLSPNRIRRRKSNLTGGVSAPLIFLEE
jgi:hypothetical protein